ncbi:Fic family protein [Kineococcus glutinatus]|uniref:Fic family protein n=1 Tax=Kineococcus glutinatus TaxID=1070872 RepID=A0ABP9HYA1_9ACTN
MLPPEDVGFAASGDAAARWPAFGLESVPWQPADAAYGPRSGRSRHQGPYEAAVPAVIAHARPSLPVAAMALVTEASAEIARFDGEVLGSGRVISFAALLLRTEAASSSQIEHLTSSPKAIALAELGRRGRANADEIVANVAAMHTALQQTEHLDVEAVLEMHRVLMTTSMPHAAGRWRSEQVWIGGSGRSPHGADYIAPVHQRVPAAMADLMAFIARDDLPVLAQAALAHAQFEAIHPFPDGNGRTGRALLHAQLRVARLAREALVPISAGLLADTGRYFQALDAYRAGDVEPIVRQVCEAVFPAVGNARRLIADVRDARARWAQQIRARRDAAALRLADLVMTRPVVDAKLVAEQLQISPVNAQVAIDRLVDATVLEQIGNGRRDRVWQAPEVLAAMEDFAARASHRVP